jgi:hypothetical protein
MRRKSFYGNILGEGEEIKYFWRIRATLIKDEEDDLD